MKVIKRDGVWVLTTDAGTILKRMGINEIQPSSELTARRELIKRLSK